MSPLASLCCALVDLCFACRDLSKHLTSRDTSARACKSIGLDDVLSSLPASAPKHVQAKVAADAFNALVAVIAVDQSAASARTFACDMLLPFLAALDVPSFIKLAQPKPLLRQLLKDAGMQPPSTS